jgi:hypothetical protein
MCRTSEQGEALAFEVARRCRREGAYDQYSILRFLLDEVTPEHREYWRRVSAGVLGGSDPRDRCASLALASPACRSDTLYRAHLLRTPELLEALTRFEGCELACWCRHRGETSPVGNVGPIRHRAPRFGRPSSKLRALVASRCRRETQASAPANW